MKQREKKKQAWQKIYTFRSSEFKMLNPRLIKLIKLILFSKTECMKLQTIFADFTFFMS